MAKTMPWGETLKVLLDVGYITGQFTLDSSTLDGSDVLDGIGDFVDVTQYITSVNIKRGRQDQLSTFSPGSCSIIADDRAAERQFDPANTASPWYQQDLGIAPRRVMQVYAGTAGDTPLWIGKVNDLDIEYSQPNISFVSITGVDDLADFGKTSLTAFAPIQTNPGDRVTEILDRTEVAYSTATRSISTATSATLGTVAYDDNDNVKSALDAVAQSEDGRFFVSRGGTATFQPRISFSFNTATVFFSDTAGTAIPYTNLSTGYGAETLINRAQVSFQGGTAASTAVGTASIAQYGVNTYALTDLPLADNAQASALARNIVTKYADPVSRFSEISVVLNGLSAAFLQTMAGLEIGDIVQVTKTFSMGSPATVAQNVFIESISHSINPQIHTMTLGLGQAQLLSPFILDTSELDDALVGLG